MAKFDISDFEDFAIDFAKLAELPDDVIDGMLNAEADVVVQAQKESAVKLGVVDSGRMKESIQKGRVTRSLKGTSISVYPKGSRSRSHTTTREAEIAFINEFGKQGQPARPFILTANESCADEAVSAAEKVYDNYLQQSGLT